MVSGCFPKVRTGHVYYLGINRSSWTVLISSQVERAKKKIGEQSKHSMVWGDKKAAEPLDFVLMPPIHPLAISCNKYVNNMSIRSLDL